MTSTERVRARASTEEVHDRLRADILAGVHPPGSRLKFAPLAERYAASVGVLREALTRLCEQRLVTSEPRIGFTVAALSDEDLRDLTATRIEIESVAVRLAVARGSVDWESALVAAHHRLERTPMRSGEPLRVSDEWETAHAAFHRAVLAGCGSPRLMEITDELRDSAELYRRWAGVQDQERDVPGEHRRILEAVLARDAKAASRALAEHYEGTLQTLLTQDRPESAAS
ncbi:GntR family transcriptional regulator [Enemella evansiae]|uniref:GntR family transcriptional regulator n=1 Tax=Enemella evansiae TaxID=2016499 RepID=UPI000C00C1F6|nr:FCD domain-containing protein [Enemella evansiae]PFG65375.1 DNA-binding GntR family transcriptional regulator [Propionibacteriaceae bacterium ES.041]